VAPLILASRSPQRRAILEQVGVDFRIVVPEVQELTTGDPASVVAENARRKAHAVAAPEGAAVLGVDTVVALEGRVYGKPVDEAAARSTLATLAGRTHTVLSGVCVRLEGEDRAGIARTEVRFRALDPGLLDWYVATGEWRERAGGYAVQLRGAALVERIDGEYLNIVGLPLALLIDLHPAVLEVS
jgi:nucleoside triphosphate pyrophosphatase